MAVGRLPEGNDHGGESIVAEINITPLTDIFLVLLIIFMVTSSAMVESGPSVNLPEAGETSTEAKGVTVTVDETESLFVDGAPTTRETLTATLQQAIARSESKRVVLQGDRTVILADVVYILDEARRAGASEVAIAATRK